METALVKTLEKTDVPVACESISLSRKESGNNQSLVDTDLIHFPQLFVVPKMLVLSDKVTICL